MKTEAKATQELDHATKGEAVSSLKVLFCSRFEKMVHINSAKPCLDLSKLLFVKTVTDCDQVLHITSLALAIVQYSHFVFVTTSAPLYPSDPFQGY